ncbi:alpha/beta hydrolase [Sphingomonas psychrotolerans]|uniref:Alpha/beta hydrolase n=1 Tax=Sphingomonas psychrotolerans TaxID=1327635 RepID=A0A2K8MD32_9SPHN|nr:alpha/beta hydrolase [Sphingomonas psychrotolerans]ATY31800.1 alpha/beta hydrolase [Sphingomonas psychrotolerans]
MPIDRRTLIGGAMGLTLATAAKAQNAPTPYVLGTGTAAWPPREHFKLWPGTPPGAPSPLPTNNFTVNGSFRELWLRGVSEPMVGVYRPAKPDGRAVLSIPGGGYGFISVENEGVDVAKALTPHGITVFVLAYRLPGEGWANRADVPLQDAQRAMRLIRAQADKFGVDPAKLGICGFSAGGHLGASLAVGHADPVYAPVDPADRQSARPDFAGLVYPVVSFNTAGLNSRSAGMLLGDSQDPVLLARYAASDRITADTPPIFLVHAIDDGTVPVAQSLLTIEKCRAANVPVEAHILEKGGHGFGALHLPADSPGRLWTDVFARWTARR